MPSPAMNSRAWWDAYFAEHWEANGGRRQTRHFMERLLASLPARVLAYLGAHELQILDWGCALGEGVELLSQTFPRARVAGLDFSSTAIASARQHYPGREFIHTASGAIPSAFDVIVSSNCLEHFETPLQVMAEHLRHCRKLYLALVPFNEQPLSPYHHYRFETSSFPRRLGSFERLFLEPIDVDPTVWAGQQVLVVYGSPGYLLEQDPMNPNPSEQEKWDRHYASLPPPAVDEPTSVFDAELAAAVAAFLAPGSRTLEAGSGGGGQSLALARLGQYDVSLMDFSAEALAYSQRAFARQALPAQFIQGDVLQPGTPAYDLVFNAGVLEHYTFAEQVAFLRGMASRSRAYVLVLVPNRLCYWYWLWRVNAERRGQWPFGKEVPLVDLSAAFEAAGLHVVGHAFMGQTWTEQFIAGVGGLDAALRDEILEIHRSPLIPISQKSYLTAVLGSVTTEAPPPEGFWSTPPLTEDPAAAELQAALADALALRIEGEAAQVKAQRQVLDLRQTVDRLRTQQAEQARLSAERQADLQAELQRQQQVQARDRAEGSARQHELEESLARERAARARAEAEVRQMRRSKFWRLGMAYWTRRAQVLRVLKRQVPGQSPARPRPPAPPAVPRPQPAQPPPLKPVARRRTAPSVATEKADFYAALTIQPKLPPAQQAAILETHAWPAPARPDIVCFSIIDWSFRYQRPQQIMSQFAAQGHRVFYILLTQHLPADGEAPFTVRLLKDNVYELCLAALRPLEVYADVIAGDQQAVLLGALDALRRAYNLTEVAAYVMVAAWGGVALEARRQWGWRLIYDCMDEWETFPGIGPALLEMEPRLVDACDLLVVTAQRLYDKWYRPGRRMVLARNAVDYAFFAERLRPNRLLGAMAPPIIGYYGAIAEWFDVDLVRLAAESRPAYSFVLLGGVFNVDVSSLAALPNVLLLGQQPYETMPAYLYDFDVCLIPFKVTPITQATDPVKLYEYLSAGKPVVAVTLAELEPYREFLYLAEGRADFLTQLDLAVAENDPEKVRRRQALARVNTWAERYHAIAAGLCQAVPRASLVVVTYNNLALTRLCLESIVRNTAYPNYEVIVVDNHSTDGTPDYLRAFAAQFRQVRLIINEQNQGFARANNQGLARATGDYLVLLNNDTIVPPGWLTRLLRHLADRAVGLVGPVTNFAGNEARRAVSYQTWQQMEAFARDHMWAQDGQVADIAVLAMYCVALRRDVFVDVGELDEQFGLGLFEDDDYAQRVRRHGYSVVCASDVFVHHFGQASFRQLITDGTYDALFDANRRRYEEKWQTPWVPHRFGQLETYVHPLERLSGAPPRPLAPAPPAPVLAAALAAEAYAQQVSREKAKWGQHLQVEASGAWQAWLDHPLILRHYQERSLIEGLRWEAWVAAQLEGPAEKSLDLGCGAGERSLAVYRAGASRHTDGIDLSDDRVAEGERRRVAAGVPGRFWVEDINTVSLPANTYDLIFSCHSFHHFLNLEHVLRQVAEALTPRGLFILEEFVGPTQFQWTEQQLALTRQLLSELPPALRRFRDGRLKTSEGRPTPEQVVAVSPFESIRSAEIWPLFQQHFAVVAVRRLGGTLQHLLYNGIVHNFRLEDAAAVRHIEAIYAAEDRLIDTGQIPSDFMLLVGRRLAR